MSVSCGFVRCSCPRIPGFAGFPYGLQSAIYYAPGTPGGAPDWHLGDGVGADEGMVLTVATSSICSQSSLTYTTERRPLLPPGNGDEIEATAAVDYFASWVGNVGYRWANKDRDRIPAHWHGFQGRRSLVARSTNACASDPINATLNYLYALGEIECRRACLVRGLDPGLLHVDTKGRDSLALDLIEAIRPTIDTQVLDLCQYRVFAARPRRFVGTRTPSVFIPRTRDNRSEAAPPLASRRTQKRFARR